MADSSMLGQLTCDGALDGRVVLWQSRDGYRFSVDAVLLGHFCRPARGGRTVDLGAGCGVVGLTLLARGAAHSVVAVELQKSLAWLAGRNAAHNRKLGSLCVIRADLREGGAALAAGQFDLAVANPPFFVPGMGLRSPNQERALARDESTLPLDELLRTARRLLRTTGRLGVIYPAPRLSDLMIAARQHDLEPKRLRLVHPWLEEPARLCLLEVVAGAQPGGLELEPPLVLFDDTGQYSEEADRILRGRDLPPRET